jgi:hypothetical protein
MAADYDVLPQIDVALRHLFTRERKPTFRRSCRGGQLHDPKRPVVARPPLFITNRFDECSGTRRISSKLVRQLSRLPSKR